MNLDREIQKYEAGWYGGEKASQPMVCPASDKEMDTAGRWLAHTLETSAIHAVWQGMKLCCAPYQWFEVKTIFIVGLLPFDLDLACSAALMRLENALDVEVERNLAEMAAG